MISLNGTWMQNVAQAWLVYRLTQSSFMLGLVAFCGLFPVLLFSLLGGVVADRVNRHRLLVFAHSLGLLQALVLGIITLAGWIQPWHLILMSTLLGIIHAFEMPARHSFLAEMVPREDLANAIALNSSAFNIARFLGPSLAGVLVAWFREGPVFLLNAFSFLAVLWGLLSMRITVPPRVVRKESAFRHIQEGLSFCWNDLPIRMSLLLLSIFSIVGTSMTVLMPVFARHAFVGGSEVLGILLGSMGLGALIGALTLAYRARSTALEIQIGIAGMSGGACLVLFPMATALPWALPLLLVLGFSQTLLAASINTLLQSRVNDALRGRVMSVFSMVFIGLMPIGSITAGSIAEILGVENTVYYLGLVCFAASALFLFRIVSRAKSQAETGGRAQNP